MLDYHQKLDSETKIQLIIIKLDEIEEALKKIPDHKIELSNISARLKGLEDQKLPQAINILESEVRELKKKNLETPPKKFSIMEWFR